LLTDPLAGLYAGKYTNPDNTKGDFAAVILDDHTVTVTGHGSDGSAFYGTGTVDAGGQMTFTLTDSSGATITGTGKIDPTAGSLEGDWSGGGNAGRFVGRRTTADTSDL